MKLTTALLTTAAAITLALSLSANAQEAQIRQALAERFPKLEKIDEVSRRNLTQERVNKLLAGDFSTLPLKDAGTIVRGDGRRRLAIFEDPNCGYCKLLERNLQQVNDITVYLFLYPILNDDSTQKSRNIWCAKDKAGAWQDQMLRN